MGGMELSEMRILVTSASDYMGPPVVEHLRSLGADVVADEGHLVGPDEPAALIDRVGDVDAVFANLDLAAYGAPTTAIEDDAWLEGFDRMVHPLMRLVRAVAPQMIERGRGSIVAMTSSSPLRRMRPHAISYVTARAAQNAFVRSAGHDLARRGVRLNAIAQNFVENETYYPPSIMENEKFVAKLDDEVPARRLGQPMETAELAAFLLSDRSSFIFGQVISQDGGWS